MSCRRRPLPTNRWSSTICWRCRCVRRASSLSAPTCQQQLMLCNGKVGLLAKRVDMERTHLYRKLRSLGIETQPPTRQKQGDVFVLA